MAIAGTIEDLILTMLSSQSTDAQDRRTAISTERDTAKSNYDAAWVKFLDHKNRGIKIRDDLSAEVSKAEGELRCLEKQYQFHNGWATGVSSVLAEARTEETVNEIISTISSQLSKANTSMSAAKSERDTAKSNFDAAWTKFLDHKNCGIKIRDDLSAEVSKAEGELRRLENQYKYYEGQYKGISSVKTMATTLRTNYS